MSSSVTIRVPRRDKERLERLARKTGKKKLSEAFRLALSAAEHEAESSFRGNIDALVKAYEFAKPVGGDVSEKVDKEVAEIIHETKASRKRASSHHWQLS
jgi:predicted transcriptional regulator